jgi:hypothetical protein
MCARFITGRHIQQIGEEWIHPNNQETLKQAYLLTIQEYINKRRQTVKDYVSTTNIFQICQNSKGTSTSRKKLTWWENYGAEDAKSIETKISANSGSDLPVGQGENVYDWEFPQ